MRKAIFIGLILGILVSFIGIVGISYCGWNPAHYVDRGALCEMTSIFYLLIIPQSLVFYSIVQSDGTGEIIAFFVIGLITIVEFILISIVVSWIYKKLKNRT